MPKNSGAEKGSRMGLNHGGSSQETRMNKFWDVIAAVTLRREFFREGRRKGT